MKKCLAISLWACFLSTLSGGLIYAKTLESKEKVVNVYNWAAYIPEAVIQKFESETGIRINYSTFDSNEVLYTKLKANPDAGYDVVVPSTYVVQRMIKENLLQPLDKSKLTYFNHLDPKLLNEPYDPNNQYSIPYLWGTTGIILHNQYFKVTDAPTWKSLWDKKFGNRVALLDDMRDVFGMGLKAIGYSINDTDPDHIRQAYLKLKNIMPNILSFESDGSQQTFVNEDAVIGMIASGDANMVIRENAHFQYVFPKDGPLMWMDNMVIPRGAKHLENAYRFINFILRPEIAKMISEGVGYSTPNADALKLMPGEMKNNHAFNPTAEDIKNGEFEEDIGTQAHQIYLKYWELLKLGG